jgi:hypothetical protein
MTLEELDLLLPLTCYWAKQQESYITKNGAPLDNDQKIDAYLIGIKKINKVRLLKVDQIPTPSIPELKNAAENTGLLSSSTIGVTFRYGIYIRSDFWNQRSLLIHELTHTMQYERLGGFKPFLEQYLNECITVKYPNGSLEQEAIEMEKEMCDCS